MGSCFNIEIMPPMLIKNCLPFDLMYEVSKEGKDPVFEKLPKQALPIILQDILQVDERVKIKFKLADSSEHTTLNLYSKGKNADEMDVPLFDRNGKSFYIKCLLDSKKAGICITLYAE